MMSMVNTMCRRVGTRSGALAAMLLLGCGGDGSYGSGTTTPPPAERTVSATPSLAFSPASLSVKAGEDVTFAFGRVEHNVFFDAKDGAPADIPGENAGVSVTRTFPAAGTYRYSCHIHPSMHGTVVVQDGGSS